MRKPRPSCLYRGIRSVVLDSWPGNKSSLASCERKVAAVGRKNGKAALDMSAPSPGSSCYLTLPVIILGSHLRDSCCRPSEPLCQACTGGRVGLPVGRRPGDPTARRWHQHRVPFLGQPHPLLHEPGFPLHVILSFLCGTKRGDECQEGRKYNFYT